MGDRTRAKKNVIPMVPALTTYRAHMMLMTTLAILAVDFPIFPRALAKCETFGVSLMDIGVGSFVFSQGVVSALPVLKNPDHLYAYPLPKIMASARKVLPILALGLIRVVLVKGVDYPEHVSEYGVHWNFFVTLAVLPVVQTALDPLIARFSITSLGVLVATAHQTTLSYLGGSHYILEAPRIGIISANKEGILSLPGYLSIHLLGLSLGTILLPPDPNFLRKLRRRNQASNDGKLKASSSDSEDDDEKVVSKAAATEREPGKTAIELCSYAIVWWTLLGLCQWTSVGGGVSRRMANLPYILWVAAYNTTFILGYFALDMWFFSPPSLSKLQSRSRPSRGSLQGQGYETTSPVRRSVTPEPQAWASTSTYASAGKSSSSRRPAYARDDSRYARLEIPPTPTVPVWDQSENSEEVRAPALLDAINRNGLMIFLLANLATGLVNLTMPTMYMSDGPAMTVLVGYSLALSAAAWFMRSRRIIKL
ncbi:hypothetical protein PUNSTDRAFT_49357 [Punctularia strigosozonata HHB-11173 SS5]|uniref:uncharacterized protein n=1 Tax=Punctularia strigosozonata (strain HHB-11173) TaxID=741275 RepID=UPI00044164E7|nr:uncharacterized protein PUNSTDRAFT_49357 [Punctularia strigosozonata HHB-11173 SS5]EIN14635.1 hypothetical protein PUNSTDRAFT_49357 [Punctularia strigosozonata HHB-11173 SS5]